MNAIVISQGDMKFNKKMQVGKKVQFYYFCECGDWGLVVIQVGRDL